MATQFSHAAGKLTGSLSSDPSVTVVPAKFHGFVATATDPAGNSISIWAPDSEGARNRVEALWHGIV